MEVHSLSESLLRMHVNKENLAYEEGLRDFDLGKDSSRGIQICVAASEQATSPNANPEPLSPSKRFQQNSTPQIPAVEPSCELPSDRVDAKQQICFDYTKGVCKRGAACKYSHDVEEIVRVNSQERGVCFDFLRNSCQRGLLCRFSHDLTSIVVQDQGAMQAQKPGRKNAPICYDFVKGVCKRDDCRYSHDIFSIIRGKHANAGPEICYDFTRGKCNRGSACRYSHDVHPSECLPALPTTDPVAALAAHHAQLAAAAAVIEASRRQSAPGCLQAASSDPLFGWLGNFPAQLPSGLSEAAVSQAALALQLQSQYLLQLQAQAAAANLLQSQGPGLSNWEQSAATLRSLSSAGLPPAALPPPSFEPRRHTHDGSAGHRLPPDMLLQLQEMNLRQNLLETDQQMKLSSELQQQGLLPRDSLSGESTIGANWQSGRSTPGLPQPPPLPFKQQQMMMQRSFSLTQPFNSQVSEQRSVLGAGRSASHRLPDHLPPQSSQAGLSNLGNPGSRVPSLLRPVQSNPVTRRDQADLFGAIGQSRLPGELPPPGDIPLAPHSSNQAPQMGTTEGIQSISFQDRPQAIGREQLALFQEIWRN